MPGHILLYITIVSVLLFLLYKGLRSLWFKADAMDLKDSYDEAIEQDNVLKEVREGEFKERYKRINHKKTILKGDN